MLIGQVKYRPIVDLKELSHTLRLAASLILTVIFRLPLFSITCHRGPQRATSQDAVDLPPESYILTTSIMHGSIISPLIFFVFGALFLTGFALTIVLFVMLLTRGNGKLGESRVNSLVNQFLDKNIYHLIPDVMLPLPDGTTQIDHVVVSRYGIFVIETKTYKGWIYGNENDSQWTQVLFKRKEHFQNPLRQNYRHTKTLSELTGIPQNYFKSVVVFAGKSVLKTKTPANVIHVSGLIPYIRNLQEHIIKDEQVSEITQVIQQWAGTVSAERKAQHVANLRQSHAPAPASGTPPVCPRCGSTMVLRTNRRDNSQFWGCPMYPDCHGIRKLA